MKDLWQRVKCGVFACFPMHWISRLTFFLSRVKSPIQHWVIRRFIHYTKVDMEEARRTSVTDYESFDDFFTRRLKESVRPVCTGTNEVASPCDGLVLQSGSVTDGTLIQAKGRSFSIEALLTKNIGKHFKKGKFCTIYLAPKDYHRTHIPVSGKLEDMVYIPGRLMTVAPYIAEMVDDLYARNERVVCLFNTRVGKMAVVMVGGVNVAAIEMVWHGLVCPPHKAVHRSHYTARSKPKVSLKKGEELGAFHIGSTVILIFENTEISWHPANGCSGSNIKMGQQIASCATEEE